MNISQAIATTAFSRIFHDDPKAVVVLERGRFEFFRIREGEKVEIGVLWTDDLLADDWKVRVEWSRS